MWCLPLLDHKMQSLEDHSSFPSTVVCWKYEQEAGSFIVSDKARRKKSANLNLEICQPSLPRICLFMWLWQLFGISSQTDLAMHIWSFMHHDTVTWRPNEERSYLQIRLSVKYPTQLSRRRHHLFSLRLCGKICRSNEFFTPTPPYLEMHIIDAHRNFR